MHLMTERPTNGHKKKTQHKKKNKKENGFLMVSIDTASTDVSAEENHMTTSYWFSWIVLI